MFCAFSRLLVFFLQINISLLNLQCSRVFLPVKTVYLQRQSNADFAIGGYQSQTLLACISLCLRRAKCRGLDFSDSLQLCQLNGAMPSNVGNFSSDFVGVSLDSETIQQYKLQIGPCMDHGCVEGSVCVPTEAGSPRRYRCVLEETCDDPLYCRTRLYTNLPSDCTLIDLVNGSYPVTDDQLTASSEYDSKHGPRRARLYTVREEEENARGGWVSKSANVDQYIQVHFEKTVYVNGIKSQGRDDYPQWVTSFKMLYSIDCVEFLYFKLPGGNHTIFYHHLDQWTNLVVTNLLPVPVMARCVRLNPQTWVRAIALRFDLLGCRP